MNATHDFSDLDDLDSQPAPAAKPATFLDAQAAFAKKAEAELPKCPKCNGSGKKLYGYVNLQTFPCGFCKGTGRAHPDRQKRIDRFKKGVASRAQKIAVRAAQYRVAYAAEYAWLTNAAERGFDFAGAMLEAISKYGELTGNQLDATRRCMEKAKARAEARKAEQEANAPALATDSVDKLKAALQKARDNKLKFARIVVDELTFTLAGDASRNPGAVYVKAHGVYAGKVQDGRYIAARGGDAYTARVQTVMVDPLAAAREYGLRTGTCSCCGRELTDPRSIERGIGPICEAKFF